MSGVAVAGAPPAGGEDGALPAIVRPPVDCARAAKQAKFRGTDLVLATAVALAESGCDPKAQGYNPPSEDCPAGSIDRGAWQINSCYHPEVPDRCAYKLRCSAKAARDIWSDAGGSFNPWTAYKLRTFKTRLSEARRAVLKITGRNIVVGVVTTSGGALTIRAKPRTSSEAVGSLPNDAVIRVRCQTKGESVYSEVFGYETTIWDKLGRRQYVSDGYVYTDDTGFVADRCGT
jgi:hypothetical protein